MARGTDLPAGRAFRASTEVPCWPVARFQNAFGEERRSSPRAWGLRAAGVLRLEYNKLPRAPMDALELLRHSGANCRVMVNSNSQRILYGWLVAARQRKRCRLRDGARGCSDRDCGCLRRLAFGHGASASRCANCEGHSKGDYRYRPKKRRNLRAPLRNQRPNPRTAKVKGVRPPLK